MGVTTDFSISGLGFRLDTPWPVPVTGNFGDFAGGCGRVDWTVTFQEVDSLPDTPGEEVFRNYFLAVYGSGGRYLRRYHSHTDFDRPYAVTDCDWDSGTVRVRYLGGDRGSFAGSAGCFSHIGFEELLIGRGRLILHASLVDSPFGGILFSGASGVGKSTQGELWKRYEGDYHVGAGRRVRHPASANRGRVPQSVRRYGDEQLERGLHGSGLRPADGLIRKRAGVPSALHAGQSRCGDCESSSAKRYVN